MSTHENGPSAPDDDLDGLYSYDVNMDNAFQEFNADMEAPPTGESGGKARNVKKGADLGIEDVVHVAKKRKPIAKLDENRLLSQAGIPKLRRITKERLKFKGKGHEYSDVARLLNLYQLWLDDLYPRAKFADGLAIIEKLGHTRRMQTMRREWISEGKPRDKFAASGEEGSTAPQNASMTGASPSTVAAKIPSTPPPNTENDELYAATPRLQSKKKTVPSEDIITSESLFVSEDESDDQPPEDDLDTLLAEDAEKEKNVHATDETHSGEQAVREHTPLSQGHNFDDEMEVLAGMDDMW